MKADGLREISTKKRPRVDHWLGSQESNRPGTVLQRYLDARRRATPRHLLPLAPRLRRADRLLPPRHGGRRGGSRAVPLEHRSLRSPLSVAAFPRGRAAQRRVRSRRRHLSVRRDGRLRWRGRLLARAAGNPARRRSEDGARGRPAAEPAREAMRGRAAGRGAELRLLDHALRRALRAEPRALATAVRAEDLRPRAAAEAEPQGAVAPAEPRPPPPQPRLPPRADLALGRPHRA